MATEKDTADFQVIIAVFEQNLQRVEDMIRQGADVTDQNNFCASSPLAIACELQSVQIVNLILSSLSSTVAKQQINGRTPHAFTPLLNRAGSPEIVNLLISNGADISDNLLVYRAFARKKFDVAEALILAGCSMQQQNDFTLLQLVLQDQNHHFLELLLACGYTIPSTRDIFSSAPMGSSYSFLMILASCSIDIDDAMQQYNSVGKVGRDCYGNRLSDANMTRTRLVECLAIKKSFIARRRLQLHRKRICDICLAFNSLPVLITVELIDASCLFAPAIAFHVKWEIARTIKHFKTNV
jgi:hypothetical protein